MTHTEPHKSHRTGWLRAAVLGANDGIVSTSSLIIGVASAQTGHAEILLAGLAGLVAGALSMAAGEYVSVSSQSDTEHADLDMEQQSLDEDYEMEVVELALIYEERGLNPQLARQVAEQLMEHDALGAHARDEIGISETLANPIQAALSSGATFTCGAALPLLTSWFVPLPWVISSVACLSLVFLAGLGVIAAHLGGAPKLRAALRVTTWGGLAMLGTALVGRTFELII